jgi:predicted dehydrogenase
MRLPRHKKIGCAVVGLKQGLESVLVLLNHPAFELKVACDVDREPYQWITGRRPAAESRQEFAGYPHIQHLLRQLAGTPGTAQLEECTRYEEVLQREDIEAVLLYVPDALHEPMALAALHAGKYVLCTKPMAMTLESAQLIARTARAHPRRYMLGFHYTYSPFARRVLELIHSGALGRVRQLSFHYHRGQFRPVYRTKAASRGPIVQECCHWFDLFYRFTGQARFTQVAGFGGLDLLRETQDVEDNGALIIEYEGPVRAALLFSYFRPSKSPELITINGDRGQLRGSFERLVLENDGGESVIEVTGNRRLPGIFHDGYYEMHDEFAAMIREGREPYSDWRCGLENVLISAAAQAALDRRTVIPRPDVCPEPVPILT